MEEGRTPEGYFERVFSYCTTTDAFCRTEDRHVLGQIIHVALRFGRPIDTICYHDLLGVDWLNTGDMLHNFSFASFPLLIENAMVTSFDRRQPYCSYETKKFVLLVGPVLAAVLLQEVQNFVSLSRRAYGVELDNRRKQ